MENIRGRSASPGLHNHVPPMIRRLLTIALLSLFAAAPAWADDSVSARSAAHGSYSRVVFEWPAPVTYTSNEANGGVTVTFSRAANLNSSVGNDANVTGFKTISTAGQPLSVKIDAPAGGHFRVFSIGKRVIVDVYGAGAAPSAPSAPVIAAAPEKHKETKKVEAKKPAPKVAAVKPPAPKAPAPKVAETKPAPKVTEVKPLPKAEVPPPAAMPKAEAPPAMPKAEAPVVEVAKPAPETNTVTMSMTESSGMAAFVRNGNLWIVIDNPGVAASPLVSGPGTAKFGPFKRWEFTGGVAFQSRLPEDPDFEIYGEGGGLVWKVLVTKEPRDAEPVVMQRNFGSEAQPGATAFWPLPEAMKILELPDPDVGDKVKVVTVSAADEFAGPQQDTIDFTALRSIIGLAVVPKVDDLTVTRSATGIKASRPGGLTLSPQRDVSLRAMRHDIIAAAPPSNSKSGSIRRVFDFEKWMMGGLEAVEQNQRILKSGLSSKDKNGRVQDLLTMAKMNVANDRGPEALGFLSFAAGEMSAIADAPEYKAIKGAAEALAGKYEEALDDLEAPELAPYMELGYWRAYTLGWLGDWQQAHAALPADQSVVLAYPLVLRQKIAPKLAEVALHAGDVKTAESILGVMEKDRARLPTWALASIDYLEGEAHRQKGEEGKAKDLWMPLSTGKDHLYRAKAGLALTMLQMQKGDITAAQAIDRLEGLRYVWRGDELESRINFLLGRLYLDDKQYLKGFSILKDAAGMSPGADAANEITAFMKEQFKALLMDDKSMAPLDAALIYEEFPELMPGGEDGDKMAQRLAERLVEADLLPRAASLLQKQVDTRLQGADQARVASRLAAIHLLDKEPQKAMKALDVAQGYYEKQTDKDSATELHRVHLMRARALSQLGRTPDALAMLAEFPPAADVNSLRADIAWQAGLWDQAATALNDMILDEGIDPAKPLTQKQADLILNRGVALNLSGNHVALANLFTRYRDAMSKTSRAKLFDVVARPRESVLLSDKQTLAAIVSEVDIFKDFLDTYRSADVSQ